MKTIQKIAVFMLCIFIFPTAFAWDTQWEKKSESANIAVYTTEYLPGANCKCVKGADGKKPKPGPVNWASIASVVWVCGSEVPVNQRLYVCDGAKKGIGWFQELIKTWVQWILQFAMILGVMAIAALGVAWAMAWNENPEYKKFLKDWIVNLMIGLAIIFFYPHILSIFSWIFK